MQNTWPVVMYPEGVIVGKVVSGRARKGAPVRHVAKDADGITVGTFDTFVKARAALEEKARQA